MTLVAGIDIGNATTEIVFARLGDDGLYPVLAEQVPTRGAKGSSASITAAAALVRRMSDRIGETPGRGAGALVRTGTGYAHVAAALNRTAADVVAVALADDEAVLVGNRLETRVPVVDQ